MQTWRCVKPFTSGRLNTESGWSRVRFCSPVPESAEMLQVIGTVINGKASRQSLFPDPFSLFMISEDF